MASMLVRGVITSATRSVEGGLPVATTLLRRSRSVRIAPGLPSLTTTTHEMLRSRMRATMSTRSSSAVQLTTLR